MAWATEEPLDLSELQCRSIAKEMGDRFKVGALSGWAPGIGIFRMPDVLYLPEYGLPVCAGFVPEEAINYGLHLDVRLGRRPGERLEHPAIVNRGGAARSPLEVCILGNIYSHVFGHWAEELLKVVIMERFGFVGCYAIPAWYPAFCRETLGVLGIPPERISDTAAPIVYAAAFFSTTVSHFTAHRFPHVVLRLRDELHAASRREVGVGQRIWIERGKSAAGRDVLNKEEVHSCIRRHGFVQVDFGEHLFRKQIAIDRDATVMAGPHGSAFVHCGFMRNNRTIIEIFSPHHINPSVIQLCMALGHRYNQIVPTHQQHWQYPHGLDLMVDIDHLELVLSSLPMRRKTWWRGFTGS